MIPRRQSHHWLHPGGKLQPWIDALRAIDQRGDKSELVELLKSDVTIPADARQHLADLLERHNLKLRQGGRGGRTTPSYDLPHGVVQLDYAVQVVRRQMKEGKTRAVAVQLAVEISGMGAEAILSHLAGKHTSARLAKKRRPLVK
jgi:hypothetical protein